MPPPPPPSKSYLLVLDSDSEDDSVGRLDASPSLSFLQQHPDGRSDAGRTVKPTWENNRNAFDRPDSDRIQDGETKEDLSSDAPHRIDSDSDRGNHEGDGDDCYDDSHPNNSLTQAQLQRKKRKNQKKKKNKKKKKAAAAAAASEKRNARSVTFSDELRIREYERCFGEDSVPSDGGWPLGMELRPLQGAERTVSMIEYMQMRQEELHERWQKISSAVDDDVRQHMKRLRGRNGKSNTTPPSYETRQWDYKRRIRNPLFQMLTEDQRRTIFLEAENETNRKANLDDRYDDTDSNVDSENSVRSVGSANASPCNGSGSGSSSKKNRQRSNSFHQQSSTKSVAPHPSSSSSSPSKSRRTRSNSFATTSTSSFPTASQSLYSDKYNQVYVDHVRNELELLRNNRTSHIGCNCRKLHVYLPPKDGSGGKKSQHRRMKPSKITQELRKRHVDVPAHASREELEQLLHDTVTSQKSCCWNDDCFCVRNDINCQADTCSCWYASHQTVSSSSSAAAKKAEVPTTEQIGSRCGNKHGMYVVDLDSINDYRNKMLSMVCQPVGAST